MFTPFASFAWGISYKVVKELGKIISMYFIFREKSKHGGERRKSGQYNLPAMAKGTTHTPIRLNSILNLYNLPNNNNTTHLRAGFGLSILNPTV